MISVRLLYLLGCLAACQCLADELPVDGVVDRIAVHFEVASSRLRPEDAASLEQFVSRARNTPGAQLALLVPITSEPARSRFVAARVGELERHVQTLVETGDYRRIAVHSNADMLWLALVLPVSSVEESRHPIASPNARPVDLAPTSSAPLMVPATPAPPSANPAEIRLTDWLVRGVKRPPQGPLSAYVARTAPGAVPRQVFEQQVDSELGLIKEISLAAEGGWVVRTEIGWIGQSGPSGSP